MFNSNKANWVRLFFNDGKEEIIANLTEERPNFFVVDTVYVESPVFYDADGLPVTMVTHVETIILYNIMFISHVEILDPAVIKSEGHHPLDSEVNF